MNYDYKYLTPFKWFILENFPFIEEDFDALTNWQLFCKLGKEMNKIIESVNLTGEQVENLTNAFNELKSYVDNYFENLDVQEEINNKLDAMVEDGTLTEIITSYLQVSGVLAYDTVADLKSATNLINGSFVRTLGYYEKDDGGGAFYKITDTENNSVYQEELNNRLYATLILNNKTLILENIGCYGNGENDDTLKIQEAITYAVANTLTILGNKNYKITDTITIPTTSNLNINIKKITTNIENKPLFYLNHTRRSTINIETINNTNKIDVPEITGVYNHQTAFLLHGNSYLNIDIKNINNFVCAFTLYSTNGSGAEGCYYNNLICRSANVFLLTHLFNLNGAINGNTFENCLHYIEEWTNPLNLNGLTILNDGQSTTLSDPYTNNHNVFNNLMIEKPTADDNTYYVANLENASNFHIYVDRIEIKPSLDLTKLAIFNSASSYNLIKFNTAWFTIPTDKIRTGNNNIITSYTNYSSSLLDESVVNPTGFILNENFNKVSNDIGDGHIVFYPRTGQYRVNGIFRNEVDLTGGQNYLFAKSKTPKSGVISTGIVYQINGGNPTSFTPIGSVRQVKNSSTIYLRLTNTLLSGNYIFIDFTIE